MIITKHGKYTLLLAVTFFIMLYFSGEVQAAQEGDYTYTVSNGKAEITKYTGTGEIIAIPDELGGYPVNSIGDDAFQGCSKITSVAIPQGVISIGGSAFENCYSLSSITIPQGVTSIGNEAFYYCSHLRSITLPEGLTSIGESAFESCYSLSSINIPQGVNCIRNNTFDCCTSLTSITVPRGVTSIGDGAFFNCTSLDSIIIPQGVTSIGGGAFKYCKSLSSITIPQGVSTIANSTFDHCAKLTSVTIPPGVTNIDDSAFCVCTGLKSITIPEGVTRIGQRAFYGCTDLVDITIPQGVTSIGQYAFYCCTSLTSINIPQEVTSIEGGAFGGCSKLTSITADINNSIYTSIDGVLFNKDVTTLIACPGGLTNIAFPQGVTSIGAHAFFHSAGLTSINIPQQVTSIGDYAFGGCSNLTSINIPEGVTSIGYYVFAECSSLTSVTIPRGVTTIGNLAFYLCPNLSTINIPEGVTSIGGGAFYGTNLTSITIPAGVMDIKSQTFYNCPRLASIRFNSPMTIIFDDANTIPSAAKIIGYDPSTAKRYAEKYNRTFESLGLAPLPLALGLSNKINQNQQFYKYFEASSSGDTVILNIKSGEANLAQSFNILTLMALLRQIETEQTCTLDSITLSPGISFRRNDLINNATDTYRQIRQAIAVLAGGSGASYEDIKLSQMAGHTIQISTTSGQVMNLTFKQVDECFIATAAFGSKFTWPVSLLRHFRDQYLLTNSWGTALVNFYYRHSPPIAAMIAPNPSLKMLVRFLLAPVIGMVYMIYHPSTAVIFFIIVFTRCGLILRKRYRLA